MPTIRGAVYNLGSALQALGQTDQAFTAFSRAIVLKPDFAQAHNNLGILHYDRAEWEQALACFTTALRLQTGFFKARNNLGMALHKLGRGAEAEVAFREAIRLKPDYVESFDNLSALLLEMGRTEEAFEWFMRRAALVREPQTPSESRKHHDAEQAAFRGRAAAAVEIEGGARVPGSAINLRNNIEQISAAWRSNHPQIVVIDDLLTPQALEVLRHFCHGSTIWRDTFDGYVGARPQSGFACPLLAQVACELAQAYPAIFQQHPLLFAWAFKYEQGMSGTRVHADFAAVNVNFWITPDDANLDPETGGLWCGTRRRRWTGILNATMLTKRRSAATWRAAARRRPAFPIAPTALWCSTPICFMRPTSWLFAPATPTAASMSHCSTVRAMRPGTSLRIPSGETRARRLD